MKVLRTVKEIQEYTKEVKAQGKTIGLVPTMDACMKDILHLCVRRERHVILLLLRYL